MSDSEIDVEGISEEIEADQRHKLYKIAKNFKFTSYEDVKVVIYKAYSKRIADKKKEAESPENQDKEEAKDAKQYADRAQEEEKQAPK